LLTNADLDHVLGVLCLREGAHTNLYAPGAVRQTLDRYLGFSDILSTFSGVAWHEPSMDQFEPLETTEGQKEGSRLMYRAIELSRKPPPFAKHIPAQGAQSVAYQLMDAQTGGRLLVAPDVGALNDDLLQALSSSHAVLFDGTFWSADELTRFKSRAPKASEMGHVTIQDCSLRLLGELSARHKIYIHINNTNPILASNSPERTVVESAGIMVGTDGFEFEL